MKTHTYSTDLITSNDITAIEQVIERNPGKCVPYLLIELRQAIKNVTPNHLIVLGYMIGLIHATEQTLESFHSNNNPLSKCRAN